MATVRLKICGVTRRQDYRACIGQGVDAIGINLWSGSRRHLTVAAANELVRGVDPHAGVERVGVFVDPDPSQLAEQRELLGLDAVQLHGDRPISDYAQLGHPYVWVIRGTPSFEGLAVPAHPPKWVLLDGLTPGYGGAGQRTDWDWARAAVEHFAPLPVWLAGGLTPDNAAEAISTVRPAGIDVATGAEEDDAKHGEKDPGKIAALVAICKNHSSR